MLVGYWEGILYGVWNSIYLFIKSLSFIKVRCGYMVEIDGNRWNILSC